MYMLRILITSTRSPVKLGIKPIYLCMHLHICLDYVHDAANLFKSPASWYMAGASIQRMSHYALEIAVSLLINFISSQCISLIMIYLQYKFVL